MRSTTLRLVASPPPPPKLPDLARVYEDPVRRPGELHEALVLDPELAQHLDQLAVAATMPRGTAGRLLIEAEIVRIELTSMGVDDAPPKLDDTAGRATVLRRLSAADADYVQRLRRPAAAANTLLTVPVRLLGKIGELDLRRAMDGDLGRAVQWEIAAVLAGRTMLEWALVSLWPTGRQAT